MKIYAFLPKEIIFQRELPRSQALVVRQGSFVTSRDSRPSRCRQVGRVTPCAPFGETIANLRARTE